MKGHLVVGLFVALFLGLMVSTVSAMNLTCDPYLKSGLGPQPDQFGIRVEQAGVATAGSPFISPAKVEANGDVVLWFSVDFLEANKVYKFYIKAICSTLSKESVEVPFDYDGRPVSGLQGLHILK